MRQLHFVGLTDDKTGLVVADDRNPDDDYVVPITSGLRAALATGRRVPDARQGESSLTPRDIQARLRVGRSVVEVAGEAGVSEEWVERFAGPIRAEQYATLARVKEYVYQTLRRGPSDRPLGAAVLRNLLEKGVRVDDEDEGWSAWVHQGSEWVVSFRYTAKRRTTKAEWLADLDAGTLVALDRTAASLAFTAPAPDLTDMTGPHPVGGRRPGRASADEGQPRLPGVEV